MALASRCSGPFLSLLLLVLTALLSSCGAVETQDWKNLEIRVFYDPSVHSLPEHHQRLVKDVFVGGAIEWVTQVLRVRPLKTNILLERECPGGIVLFHNDERYCQISCSSSDKCGPVLIPEEHLKECKVCDVGGRDCRVVPSTRGRVGVAGAELVLYVSAKDDHHSCTHMYHHRLVSGAHCKQESTYDRPVAGYLNFCSKTLSDVDPENYDRSMAAVLHELIHILAFSEDLFPFFRNERGEPLIQQSRLTGEPIRNQRGRFDVSEIIKVAFSPEWTTVRNSIDYFHSMMYLVTPNVVREVRDHFDCPASLIGAVLENQNSGHQTAGNHWEKRLFGDEIMTGTLSARPVLSRFTLALLEDSGWYRPDYRYAARLHWGRGKGCKFMTDSCGGWIEKSLKKGVSSAPFCGLAEDDSNRQSCVDLRMHVGACNIRYDYTGYWLPKEYQYFSTKNLRPKKIGGPLVLADYCPFYEASFLTRDGHAQLGRSCLNPEHTPERNLGLETYGRASRCVDLLEPWTATPLTAASESSGSNRQSSSSSSSQGEDGWGAGCYEYSCSQRGRVFVHIGDQKIKCSGNEPQKKAVSVEVDGVQHNGTIVCPTYEELCENINCAHGCSGRGSCDDKGMCLCEAGYLGFDCSRNLLEELLLNCTNQTCLNGGTCEKYREEGEGEGNGMEGGDEGERGEERWVCSCPPGYTGHSCENVLIPDPCSDSDSDSKSHSHSTNSACNGRGECLRIDRWQEKQCVCDYRYEGDSCEVPVDLCKLSGQPCVNGTCVPGQTDCACDLGFTGALCEQPLDECPQELCLNGATCRNTSRGFACVCPIGYEGMFCQDTVDHCKSKPCLNGGSCTSLLLLETYQCSCPEGYYGKRCKKRVDPCGSNPCLNGAECQDLEDGVHFLCDCRGSIFTGDLCQDVKRMCCYGDDDNTSLCLERQCLCPLGRAGPECTQETSPLPCFYGNGYLPLWPSSSSNSPSSILVSFLPRSPDGLILFWGMRAGGGLIGDFISLGLRGGRLEYRLDLGSGEAVITSNESVRLDRWNVALLLRHHNYGTLVTETGHASNTSRGSFQVLSLGGSTLFLGGSGGGGGDRGTQSRLPAKVGRYTSGLWGCVSHLEVDNRVVEFVVEEEEESESESGQSSREREEQRQQQNKALLVGQSVDGPCVVSGGDGVISGGSGEGGIGRGGGGRMMLCGSGGRCRPSLEEGYWCECHTGYSGSSCSEDHVPSSPAFHGNSYLTLRPAPGSFSKLNLSINFTPSPPSSPSPSPSPSSLLLFLFTPSMPPSGDFVVLRLRNGFVELTFDLGSGPLSITSNTTVTLGCENVISVYRDSVSCQLRLNHTLIGEAPSSGNRHLQLSDSSVLLLGGLPWWQRLPPPIVIDDDREEQLPGLEGCVSDVWLNGRRVDLTSQTLSSKDIHSCRDT